MWRPQCVGNRFLRNVWQQSCAGPRWKWLGQKFVEDGDGDRKQQQQRGGLADEVIDGAREAEAVGRNGEDEAAERVGAAPPRNQELG